MFNSNIKGQGTIKKNLEKVHDVLYDRIEDNLKQIASIKVREAIAKSTFKNVTYNLRASMGARLYKNNKLITQVDSSVSPQYRTESYVYNLQANLKDTYKQINIAKDLSMRYNLVIYAGMQYGRKVTNRNHVVLPPLSEELDKKRVKRGLKSALRGISFGNG